MNILISLPGLSFSAEGFTWSADSAFSEMPDMSGQVLVVSFGSSGLPAMAEAQKKLYQVLEVEALRLAAEACLYIDEFNQLRRLSEQTGGLSASFELAYSPVGSQALVDDVAESVKDADTVAELDSFDAEIKSLLQSEESNAANKIPVPGVKADLIDGSQLSGYADGFDKSIPYFSLLVFSGSDEELDKVKGAISV